ncbi:MAG: hypothetical protein BAJALOKI1v1_2420003 [Promethearchaeota archaeon]|nr:MAG: hypothetical protein BAJALOKI1v1_2420003 [Candidatus Lokiarchaeota archaeon]
MVNGEFQPLLVYAFQFQGSQGIHYLGVAIDGLRDTNYGRIHTAFPITADGGDIDLFDTCERFFTQNPEYIKEDVDIPI